MRIIDALRKEIAGRSGQFTMRDFGPEWPSISRMLSELEERHEIKRVGQVAVSNSRKPARVYIATENLRPPTPRQHREPQVTFSELCVMLNISSGAFYNAQRNGRIPSPDGGIRPIGGGKRPVWRLSVARALVAKRDEIFPKARQ